MFLLSRRQAHAALAGAAAAATYLAAAEIGSKRPVRFGGLFLLSSAALAVMTGLGATSRASAKATATEARLNNFFANGGQVGGDFVVNGTHTVTGRSHHLGGATMGASLDMSSNRMDNVKGVNDNADWVPSGGIALQNQPLWTNGGNIYCTSSGGQYH